MTNSLKILIYSLILIIISILSIMSKKFRVCKTFDPKLAITQTLPSVVLMHSRYSSKVVAMQQMYMKHNIIFRPTIAKPVKSLELWSIGIWNGSIPKIAKIFRTV